MPSLAHFIAGDGMFYSVYVSNGEDAQPPVRFLPPGANAQGLIVLDNLAYVATTGSCGGVANGVWALDLESKQVSTWKSESGAIAGTAGAAIGPDGAVYAATTGAGGSVVALEPKTLQLKARYTPGQEFTSTPVVFSHKSRILVAAATADGRIHLLDAATLGGADQKSALFQSPAAPASASGALASWEDSAGTRWLLAATAPSSAAGAITAWKLVDRNGSPALESGWTSREMTSPLPPLVMNGVVFAVSGGEFRTPDSKVAAAERARRSSPAVLYALDAETGKELWNSGKTITSFARGALSGGGSQLYLTTYDSTLYAFGFPIEH
jgi:outer membrane protein assembly factor BamB